jgi:hypothetical protein
MADVTFADSTAVHALLDALPPRIVEPNHAVTLLLEAKLRGCPESRGTWVAAPLWSCDLVGMVGGRFVGLRGVGVEGWWRPVLGVIRGGA